MAEQDSKIDKWVSSTIALGALFGGAIALAEHLKGDEANELGSYYATVKSALEQRQQIKEDPETLLLQLPENRTITRFIAMVATTLGAPIRQQGEPLPGYDVIPPFVHDIRAFRIPGTSQVLYEEVDIIVQKKKRTLSALVGRYRALSMYNSPEPNRAFRVLSGYDLGQQAMREHGISYDPPEAPTPIS